MWEGRGGKYVGRERLGEGGREGGKGEYEGEGVMRC